MKQLYLKCVSILLLCLVAATTYAQTRVTGKVTDQSGQPLPGVSVTEKGTKNGTSTDSNGSFAISVAQGSTLVFKSVGLLTREVPVGSSGVVNVSLSEDEQTLTEVNITTALGVKKEKKAVGYAVQEVKGKDLTIAQAPTIAQGLLGKVAGLNITQASGGVEGGSARIVVRGNTSLTGDNRALIIVDGVAINNDPVNNNSNNGGGGATGTQKGADVSGYNDWGTGLNFINPEDIENVTVLKGPAAAALYGARGANGVILVTRKKGESRKGLGVDYSYSDRTTKAYEFLDFQNEYGSGLVGSLWTADQSKQFPVNAAGKRYQIGTYTGSYAAGDYRTGAYGMLPYNNSVQAWDLFSFPSGLSWGPRFDNQPILWYDGVQRPYSAQPDNWKPFFPDGNVSQHNVSISGGGDFGTARFSYTRDYSKANILNSNYGSNTFNIGSTIKVSKKVSADITGSYINYQRLNTPPVGAGSFLAGFSYAATRDYNPEVDRLNTYQPDGSQRDVNNTSNFSSGFAYPYYSYMANAFWNIYENNTTFNRNQLIGGVKVNADITDWLNLTAQGGVDNSNDNTEIKEYPKNVQGTTGAYRQAMSRSLNRNLSALLRLHKDKLFDTEINGSLTGGVESVYRNDYTTSATTKGTFIKPFIFALNNGSEYPTSADQLPQELRYGKKLNSAFGFLDLSYKNYLFLQVTGRNDWSSTLSDPYFYPSANLSYVFSEGISGISESLPWLSFGKTTFSYAETGSDTEPYAIYNFLNSEGYNGTAAQTFPSKLKFDGIKPQRSRAYEIGLNLGFLKNRLNVEMSAYTMKSFNQILSNSLPISSGYSEIQINRGSLGNKGFEFIVNAKPVSTADFSWDIAVNGATSRTKVLALDPGNDNLSLGTFFGGNGISQRVKVGENYGTLYGKDFTYKNGQKVVKDAVGANGKVLTYTVNGQERVAGTQWVLTPDEVAIGNSQPKLTGGISNTFRYKDFSLYAMVDAKIGGDTYFGTYAAAMGNGLLQETVKERNGGGLPLTYPDGTSANTGISFGGVYADGTPNTNVVNPAWYYLGTYTSWNHLGVPRSASVFENTWVKLREVALTYRVPQALIQKTKFIQNLSISLVGRDLFYIYTSIPKGLNPEGVNGIGNMQGIEYSSIPRVRSLGFSIKSSF